VCDPIWQVTLRSSVMDLSIKSYTYLYLFVYNTVIVSVLDNLHWNRVGWNCGGQVVSRKHDRAWMNDDEHVLVVSTTEDSG